MVKTLRELAYDVLPGSLNLHQLEVGKKYQMITKFGIMIALGRLLLCEFHQGSYYTGDPYLDIRFENSPKELDSEIYREYSQNISYGNRNTHIIEDVGVE